MSTFILVCLILLVLRDAFLFMVWSQTNMKNVIIRFTFFASVAIALFMLLTRMGYIIRV